MIYWLLLFALVNIQKSVCIKKGKAVWAYNKPIAYFKNRRVYIIGYACYPVLEERKGKKCRGKFYKIYNDTYLCKRDVVVKNTYIERGRNFPKLYKNLMPYTYWKLKEHCFIKKNDRIIKRLHSGSIIPGYIKGKYLYTGYGKIEKYKVKKIKIPKFKGVFNPKLPIGWVYTWRARLIDSNGKNLNKTIPQYTVLKIINEKKDIVKTNLGWLKKKDIRIAHAVNQLKSLKKNEKWIAISYNDWTLVAYQGTKPVFATMIARGPNTPRGKFRIKVKYALSEMGLGVRSGWRFRIFGVPWTMKIIGKISLHAAFWHNEFGSHFSQGCLNLSPIDARFLYNWTEPIVKKGWFEIKSSVHQKGTLVYIY